MGLFNFFGCKTKGLENKEVDPNKEIQSLIDKSFDDFNNRKIYDKLTDNIISQTSDDHLLQTVFDNIETNFNEGEIYTVNELEKLSKGKQAIFAIWILQAEVNNGGFNQFYYNNGQFSEMAYHGLELIGAQKYSNIVKRANSFYSEIKDELEKDDDGTIESFSKSYENNPLNILDNEFYELDKKERLDDIQIKYIRNNMDQFTN